MKLLVVVPTLALLALCSAIPLNTRDSNNLVEDANQDLYILDDDGVPHYIDNEAPVDFEFLSTRNGANNKYWLYTRSNKNSAQTLKYNDLNSVKNSNYASSKALVVICHGWKNSGSSEVNSDIRSAVLDKLDANVIVVDWSGVAGNSNYYTAAAGVVSVGQYTGNFLTWLIKNAGGNWNNVHIVGHSLGAHVAGNAARQTGNKPARVTGLDAARPNWENNSNGLKKSDAQYVEAIHTDGNLLGLFPPIADADFYPNGGTNPQPGCSISTCSHSRAYQFFASSVRTNHFVGYKCPNQWEANLGTCSGSKFNMGNNVLTKRGSGIYHLRTGSSFPY